MVHLTSMVDYHDVATEISKVIILLGLGGLAPICFIRIIEIRQGQRCENAQINLGTWKKRSYNPNKKQIITM